MSTNSILAFVSAVIAALVITATAQAANITAIKDECTPKDCFHIKIEGDIQLEDSKKFDDIIARNNIKVATVSLNSNGGNLLGGLFIGFAIKDHGFSTSVPDDGACLSVCASIWTAGKIKYTSPTAHIGFHQPYGVDRHGRKVVDPKVVAFVKKYYAEIGIPKPAADFFVAATPADIYWLNMDLASGLGIKVTQWSKPSAAEAGQNGVISSR